MIENTVHKNDLKEGDTFYYILKRYWSCNENGKDVEHLEFNVFAYEFSRKWHHCFDENLMFLNRNDAEKKAREMTKSLGY